MAYFALTMFFFADGLDRCATILSLVITTVAGRIST
jgi:hypothetical protein